MNMNRGRRGEPTGRRSSAVRLLAAGLAALLAAACSGNPPPSPLPEPGASPSLQPGDAVQVTIWREPDLTGKFEVNDRGVVVFPLLGERDVTGMSPDSLEARLASEYRDYVKNPSVEVKALRRVSILGAVRQPGLYPVDETISVAEALAMAGGVSPEGNRKDIRLVRDGRVIRQSLAYATVVGSSPIRSGDQIVVGEKSWVSRNLAIVTAGIGAVSSIAVALILR